MEEVDFLKFIIENIVSNKDSINIEKTEDELWTLLTLTVAEEDMWIVIWKKWNTINSIRSILRLLGLKLDKKINIKVNN